MDNAARNGHLHVIECLHLIRSEGCTVDAMDWASQNGHLHVVKWLHENRSEGCTDYAMDNAARNGHLHVIEWLHLIRSEGCERAIVYATRNGDFNVVKYLVENKLGVNLIQEAFDESISNHLSAEEREKIQEIKNYLCDFLV